MKVVIGSDHGGYRLKEDLKPYVESLGHEVIDIGCHSEQSTDYPDYAGVACEKVLSGEADKAILVCGTGIGMCIAANKIPGIRCALLSDTFSAQATREHNDTNVLALGGRVVGPGLAREIVRVWLETPFSREERHVQRLNKIRALEEKYAGRAERA